MINGFDAEFESLDHYIRVITDRIWEGRRIDDINRYYSEDCAVETPSNVSVGVKSVIDGTIATLNAFPDRRLLAEEIIISGDSNSGFLSSHRIFSPMTHAGEGVFGKPSNRKVYVRTIADCVCINNRIVHEWLVRDQAAIARQIGSNEKDIAQKWLDINGGNFKVPMPAAPSFYVSHIEQNGYAARYADFLSQIFKSLKKINADNYYAAQIISALPGGEAAIGQTQIMQFWQSLAGSLELNSFEVEHSVANERQGRPTAVAVRWRAKGIHRFTGRYGLPTGHHIEILGITHVEYQNDLIFREWHLIDDVAVWMQILSPRT
jgi:predicted ester cyclase